LVRGTVTGTALGGIGHGVKTSTEGVEEISEREREELGIVDKGLEIITGGAELVSWLITGLGSLGGEGDVGNGSAHGDITTWGAGIGVGPDERGSGNGKRERVVSGVGLWGD
jgi:hypothetical protein